MANAKILIVEDEIIIARELEARLVRLGYDVPAIAMSGEDAVRLATERQPNLVLMDIVLSGTMDGIEAAEELHRRLRLPIIYLTAYGDDSTLERAKMTEPFGYILKPFSESELRAAIEIALYKHRMETKLRNLERWLTATLKSIGDAVLATDTDGRIIFLNPTAEALTGWTQAEALGREVGEVFKVVSKETRAPVESFVAQALREGITVNFSDSTLLITRNGEEIPIDDAAAPIRDDDGNVTGVVLVFRDITERKRMQESQHKLQQQLRQAQKMEAVGRLAGGIAHDFNNLLTVITGYSEIVLSQLDEHDPRHQQVKDIKKAGERAASLTRQLLAFSRRQALVTMVLDLNAIVTDMGKMLRRLIGEDIELRTVLEPDLWRVKGDPGQIEQVIMNLAVNARDAMPQGGALLIETANVTLDEVYAEHHLGVEPGPYVMLAMSDTGVGMDTETLSHVFEPFFTTKEPDKGTGLGLAMVYGIVQQSGGHISVESEPGQGAAFKIYLPPTEETAESPQVTAASTELPQGWETILLVEDEAMVRTLARELLVLSGYRVLETGDGLEALKLAEQFPGPIHLMLTDVVMPRMRGPEVAQHLKTVRPETKVLYMSGYTSRATVDSQVLELNAPFLRKPFTLDTLAQKVREVLDMEKVRGEE